MQILTGFPISSFCLKIHKQSNHNFHPSTFTKMYNYWPRREIVQSNRSHRKGLLYGSSNHSSNLLYFFATFYKVYEDSTLLNFEIEKLFIDWTFSPRNMQILILILQNSIIIIILYMRPSKPCTKVSQDRQSCHLYDKTTKLEQFAYLYT